MELLIKINDDRPSRVGIKYLYDYQATRAYEDLVRNFRGNTFSLRIEPLNQKLNLTLQSDQTGLKVEYKDLLYKPEQLKKLDAAITPGMSLEFVHVYTNANQVLVAKPFRTKEFFRISQCSILISDAYR